MKGLEYMMGSIGFMKVLVKVSYCLNVQVQIIYCTKGLGCLHPGMRSVVQQPDRRARPSLDAVYGSALTPGQHC